MSRPQMHDGQLETSAELVRTLIQEQFPQWADRQIRPVTSAGTVHDLYRLGDDLLVRMPVHPDAPDELGKEQRWLPLLAPRLPVAIPMPIARGAPSGPYPCDWSIYEWLEGESSDRTAFADPIATADELGRFVAALQRVEASGGPEPGRDTWFRGAPLVHRDVPVRGALEELASEIDAVAVRSEWESALAVAEWDRPPVWFHGDLMPGNLLVDGGRLAAVLDFGCCGTGDPAVDAIPAWYVFRGESRAVFRDALGLDDATWARGRGWALSGALLAIPYYRETNPSFAELGHRVLAEVLADDA